MSKSNGTTAQIPSIRPSGQSVPSAPSAVKSSSRTSQFPTPNSQSPDRFDLFEMLRRWSAEGRYSLRSLAKELGISERTMHRIAKNDAPRVSEATLATAEAAARRLHAKFGPDGPALRAWRLTRADLIASWAVPPEDIDDPVRYWRHKHKTEGWSCSQIADEVGYDESTISRVINSKYAGNMDTVRERMDAARRRMLGNHRGAEIRTDTARVIHETLDEARGQEWLYVVHGEPGIGKTRALESHSRTATGKRRSLIFTLAEETTVKSILQEILLRLGVVDIAGTTPQLLNSCILALRRNPWLLVFDECNNLVQRPDKAARVLNALRTINDNTWCGMVFCGTADLFEFLNAPRTARITAMIRTRVSVEIELPGASREEVEALLAAHFKTAEPKALAMAFEKLPRVARGGYSLRRATVFVGHVQAMARINDLPESELTIALAHAAFERMRRTV